MKIIDKVLETDKTPWRMFEPNDDKEWCVLWLQGFTSTIEGHSDGVARLAKATAVSFAMLNYAGHGDHPIGLENASREQQLNEVTGVYDELVKLGYQKIIVIGGSFGGYMAALLAKKREVHGLVLRAPANYPEEEFKLPYKDTEVAQKDESDFLHHRNTDEHFVNQATKAVSSFAGETYVVEHGQDEVINPSIPKSYFNAAQHGNYLVIPNLQHSPKTMSDPDTYIGLIELWLVTIIKAIRDNDRLARHDRNEVI